MSGTGRQCTSALWGIRCFYCKRGIKVNETLKTILIAIGAFVGLTALLSLIVFLMMRVNGVNMKGEKADRPSETLQTAVTEEPAPKGDTSEDTPVNEALPEKNDESETEAALNPEEKEPQIAAKGELQKEAKYVVCIDPAHQKKADSTKEPIGPGASETRVRVTTGADNSKMSEYELTLTVSLILKEELIKRGYEVVMTRETADVNISETERAQMANEKADAVLHIHANGSSNKSERGVFAIIPSKDNKYAGQYQAACKELSDFVLKGLTDSTGAKSIGLVAMDSLSELNWTTIPATHVEIGYMTNDEDAALLADPSYQMKIAAGLADGVDMFFEE